MSDQVDEWLRLTCASHAWEPVAIFRRRGNHQWPLVANDEGDLVEKLSSGDHFIALPKESAALANIVEVSIVDFLIDQLNALPGAVYARGSERGYPDLEVSGSAFGNKYHAIDIKVARLAKNRKSTQSRITLYTGNTYFAYPALPWPGTMRPFADYASHHVVIALYELNPKSMMRVEKLRLVTQETWRIASTQRSSTTREYLGAVMKVEDLEQGRGEFESPEEFYRYWRKYQFKVGNAVKQQLQKMLRNQASAKAGKLDDA